MRRIGRWTLNGLTVLSLVMCVAAVGESVRSIFWDDRIERNDGDGFGVTTVEVRRMGLSLLREADFRRPMFSRSTDYGRFSVSSGEAESYYLQESFERHFAGFAWGYYVVVGHGKLWLFTAPLPLVAVVFGIIPGRRVLLVRQRRRAARVGLCGRCSYDLTGNVSGVCPECGTAVAKGK